MRDADAAQEHPKPPPNDGKKHHLHLPLSQESINSNETLHPHWHLHTKSHIRRTQKPPVLRQRSKSVDITPMIENTGTLIIAKRLTPPPIDNGSPHGLMEDPNWRPPLREISLSADNLPALCLNNCPLASSPLRENYILAATPMSPLRELRPMLGMFAENKSAESPSKDDTGSEISSGSTNIHIAQPSDARGRSPHCDFITETLV